MATLQKYQQDFVLFLEAGFIAVNQMDERSALSLFEAAQLLKRDNIMPKVGMGYLHLCKMELRQAAKAFEEILKNEPNNQMAKVFLGLTMALNPADISKGEKMLSETCKECEDPAVKKLATDTIDFVDVYLKKSPSSMMSEQSKKEKKKK